MPNGACRSTRKNASVPGPLTPTLSPEGRGGSRRLRLHRENLGRCLDACSNQTPKPRCRSPQETPPFPGPLTPALSPKGRGGSRRLRLHRENLGSEKPGLAASTPAAIKRPSRDADLPKKRLRSPVPSPPPSPQRGEGAAGGFAIIKKIWTRCLGACREKVASLGTRGESPAAVDRRYIVDLGARRDSHHGLPENPAPQGARDDGATGGRASVFSEPAEPD